MTILLIDAFGMNGGAEKVMLNTYNALSKEHKVYCFLPVNSFIKKHIAIEDLVEFHSIFNLVSSVKLLKPDKVILNNKKTLKFLFPIKLFSPKVQIYYHSHSYFRNSLELAIYSFCFVPFLYSIFCVSKSLKENHTAYLINNKKHKLLYNGFNFKISSKTKTKTNKDINIFFWAQFRVWKGHLFLLNVIKKIDNPNIKFHFVANIQDVESENLLKKIKLVAKNQGIEKQVILHLNKENYLDVIQENADIALSCSQIQDPLPTIIIESLSMGIPILATNVGGSSEILEKHQTLLSSVNLDEFSSKLNQLVQNYQKINSNKLKQHFNDYFSLCKYESNILTIFKNK